MSLYEGSALLPVVIDAMGGDGAPLVAIQAAQIAASQGLGPICLVGDRALIESSLNAPLPEGVTILHASEHIGMSESPARAARAKTNSSMHVGYREVKDGRACAFITAGNSGAALTVGLLTLKRLEGCERPAIASIIPSANNPVVLLDLGANVECRATHLSQFAVLGTTYSRIILEKKRPKVGLLSNGVEANKGTEILREAHRLLNLMDLNYVGYTEARSLPFGAVDVLVTDGFVGNIVLKLSEGVVEALIEKLRSQLSSSLFKRIIFSAISKSLKVFREEVDWRQVGGAPILGLRGISLISHGSADPEALVSSIRRARFYAESNLINALSDALSVTPFEGRVSSTSELPWVQEAE